METGALLLTTLNQCASLDSRQYQPQFRLMNIFT